MNFNIRGANPQATCEGKSVTLAQLRLSSGLSQAALGKKIGWSRSRVARFEKNKDPWLSDLFLYCNGVGAELEFTLSPKPKSTKSARPSGGASSSGRDLHPLRKSSRTYRPKPRTSTSSRPASSRKTASEAGVVVKKGKAGKKRGAR